jgi:hypothetical protein
MSTETTRVVWLVTSHVVEDLSADRGHDHVPGLVLLGQLGERRVVQHLQVVEPAAERDEHRGGEHVEHHETAARRHVHR